MVTDHEWEKSDGVAGALDFDAILNSAIGNSLLDSRAIADKNGSTYSHEHHGAGIRIGSG